MNCDRLVTTLGETLERATVTQSDEGACKLTVPFERVDHDAISLWVTPTDDGYHVTDRGETYGMLYLSNVTLDQERRKRRLNSIRERYGLESAKYEVSLYAEETDLGRRLLDAVQAVQSISHLLFTRQKYTQSDFQSDVSEFLTTNGYDYETNPKIAGTSDDHRVDFDVTAERRALVETLHAENVSTARSMAQRTAFKWTDVRGTGQELTLVSVVDDESGEYDARAERVLSEYSDELVTWSGRDELLTALGPSGTRAGAD